MWKSGLLGQKSGGLFKFGYSGGLIKNGFLCADTVYLAWSAPFLKTFENMRKLDFFRLPVPRCADTAAGAGSLKKSNFLTFSKVLRIGADQAIYLVKLYSEITHNVVLLFVLWK